MRRWMGWLVVCLVLAALATAYLADPKERRGRLARPQGPTQDDTRGVGERPGGSETF